MTDSNEPQKPISTNSECPAAPNPARSLRSQMQPALPSPEEMVAHLDRHIIGHGPAKKMLAVACYDHLMQCAAAELMGGKVWPDNHSVIAGPSGCGKSAMIEVLGDYLGVPVLQIDCTNLTPHGYKGRNLSQIFDDLVGRLVDGEQTRPALLVWEEIDKLASCGDEAGKYREMSQADALRFLDGAMCGDEGRLDASRILSLGCGVFAGLDRIRDPDSISRIGFQTAAGGHGNLTSRQPSEASPTGTLGTVRIDDRVRGPFLALRGAGRDRPGCHAQDYHGFGVECADAESYPIPAARCSFGFRR